MSETVRLREGPVMGHPVVGGKTPLFEWRKVVGRPSPPWGVAKVCPIQENIGFRSSTIFTFSKVI